jgi:NAD(P)-dependent dehydrogenase (short-subunit alcohol dehydrogenase family)
MMDQPEPRIAVERTSGTTTNRIAIVTGGASGIGLALADELANTGVHVVIADRQVDLAEHAAAGIRDRGGSATTTELDVRDADRFLEVVQTTVAQTGRLDYLFNNAGIGVGGEAREFELADWNDVIDVNLRGVAHGILAAYPVMIRQGFGHIVNTASMAGLSGAPLQISYTATKHAVVGLSRALRIEARQYGVRVSALCPGVIRTPILKGGRYGRFKPGLGPAVFARTLERARPMQPSVLARRVLRAVERNRAIIIEPKWWRVLWYLDRLSPWLFEKVGERLLRQMRREIEAARSE